MVPSPSSCKTWFAPVVAWLRALACHRGPRSGNQETRALCLDAAFHTFVQGDLSIIDYNRKMKGMADALGDLAKSCLASSYARPQPPSWSQQVVRAYGNLHLVHHTILANSDRPQRSTRGAHHGFYCLYCHRDADATTLVWCHLCSYRAEVATTAAWQLL